LAAGLKGSPDLLPTLSLVMKFARVCVASVPKA
jgi:hypothetical protein